jgi:hypothetical protein
MHPLLRPLSALAFALSCLGPGAALKAASADCRPCALEELRSHSADGFAVYTKLANPTFFTSWIDCNDAQLDLSTAVHESTHLVTSETDAFPLVVAERYAAHEVSGFFPPSRIAAHFKPDDLVATYLQPGRASSATDLLYLLDELNAYTHDLNAAVDLKHMTRPNQAVDHRDGLAALMAFVASYAATAKATEPATWSGLQQPKVASVIAALWGRAEGVMASSCGIPDFGTSDKDYIRRVCSAGAQAALAPILGHPPLCPTACLEPAADVEQTSSLAAPAGSTRSAAKRPGASAPGRRAILNPRP